MPRKIRATLMSCSVLALASVSWAEEKAESLLLLDQGAVIDPGAGKMVLDYNLGFSRPNCVNCNNTSQSSVPQGLEQSVGARLGIGPNSSVAVHGFVSNTPGVDGSATSGASAEIATRLIDPSKIWGIRTGVAAGWMHNYSVDHAQFRLEASREFGDWTVAGESLLDHSFVAGADGLDMIVSFGASYEVRPSISVGAEYSAQDLEEAATPGAEGGTRQMIGPTVSWKPKATPVRVLIGPAMSFGPDGTRPVGRLGFSYSF